MIKSIVDAKKLGLRFYGLGTNLVAFTKEADDYAHDNNCIGNPYRCEGGALPYLSKNILTDSGGDDIPNYLSKQDEEKFTS